MTDQTPSLLEKALAVVAAAETLINEMSVEVNYPGVSYLLCRINRDDVRRLREAITELDEVKP